MSLVRAAFLFALLTLIVGIIGSRYLIASLFEHSPQPAAGPISAVHASSTPVHPTPTASPRPSPTAKRPPAATATVRPKPATPTATARPQRPLPTATSSSHPVATAVPMRRPSATAVTTHRPGPHPVRRARPARKQPTPAPIPTPTSIPTALPLPSPTTGVIVLARYWIGSTVARPGSIISVGYVIANGTGRTAGLSLGASIKSSRALSWVSGSISDPSHDVVATVQPGWTTHVRYFTIPRSLRPGSYDVAWGLRDATTGQRTALVFSSSSLRVMH